MAGVGLLKGGGAGAHPSALRLTDSVDNLAASIASGGDYISLVKRKCGPITCRKNIDEIQRRASDRSIQTDGQTDRQTQQHRVLSRT